MSRRYAECTTVDIGKKMVTPDYMKGFNISLAQLFGSGPKWTITCGDCHGTFKKRIPMIDYPGIPCPYCGTINKLCLEIGRLGDR